ncbi:RNA cytidine acetyltransferase 1 [Camellia lanceoleosa]|uniref:RNA cytidine acetyltransferase 1 n=1 Tax=Camellia lanceoleosa TaxID=1840588 RepID=A0ACC0J0L0_9ERIC|nr:RNA cytidine acetyltransferase 1 [Camellia lanceoleosa]
MRKKVDERIRTLIENGVKTRHRSMFFIIGDKSRDQIVNLHYMLTKAVVKSRPSVLWCYRDKLELSSHKKKRAKQVKKLMQRGLLDPEKVDPFSLFVETGGITYCLYKDSERVLGNTFGMCILQDFEALTPNLLARTIETVEGGGLIILLLRSLSSLTSLCTMVMDVHERFRTESHSEATGRFNERFLLSIASCKACVVMDDELNILPISSHMKSIKPFSVSEDSEGLSEAERDLKNLKEQLNDDFPVGPLIRKCCTLDQGKAVITFLDAILDKTLRSTIALLASRGRGKSAALGLAISGAIAAGYSNIFVTAPSPENLKTLFEFVCKGFNALEYKEHLDYDVVKSSNPEFKKSTVRINIYKQHRQTIQYIQPHEHEKLSQVELLVVDEAAAIPLPVVKSLLGPYLVFLSSTVNGYEGTGRSLSLKLLQQLEEQSQMSTKSVEGSLSGRLFKKIELSESIRYASGDPIESWLHSLLCLDVTNFIPNINRLPSPSECDLYYVNRDTLFSYHKDSELFLQVCLEGQISRRSAMKSLSDGHQPFGDQIPWKFCEQFQDTVFPTLSGARIVRIATHPSAMRLGYGSTAVELLTRYFEGQLTPISEVDVENASESPNVRVTEAAEKVSLLEENIKPRTDLPPLLVHLHERQSEKLHYIGVSFGLTQDLFRFWRKLKFAPFYISQIPNAVTGEHTCMVLKPLNNDDVESSGLDQWGFFGPFYQDFRQRFIGLLQYSFRDMEYKLAMSVLDPKINFAELEPALSTTSNGLLKSLNEIMTPHDMKRLEAYTNNLADFRLILDLVANLSLQYFREKIPVTLSYTQASVLLCIGLQHHHDISYIEGAMKLERQQILSLFIKVMKKFYKYLYDIAAKEIDSVQSRLREIVMEPHAVSVDEDLNEAAQQVEEGMKAKMDGMLNPELLQQYAIADREADFEKALQNGGGKIASGGLISVKSSKKKAEKHGKQKEGHNSGKKRDKEDGSSSKSNKKRKS